MDRDKIKKSNYVCFVCMAAMSTTVGVWGGGGERWPLVSHYQTTRSLTKMDSLVCEPCSPNQSENHFFAPSPTPLWCSWVSLMWETLLETLLLRREYCMIYRGPGFLAVVWDGSSTTHLPSILPSATFLSFSVSPVKLTDRRGVGGRGCSRSQIIQPGRNPGPLWFVQYSLSLPFPQSRSPSETKLLVIHFIEYGTFSISILPCVLICINLFIIKTFRVLKDTFTFTLRLFNFTIGIFLPEAKFLVPDNPMS